MMNNARKVFLNLIDIPINKLLYIIRLKEYVKGIWDCAKHYGIEHTKENHDLLVELVQEKLEGPDLEREWTEDEYNNFVLFNN